MRGIASHLQSCTTLRALTPAQLSCLAECCRMQTIPRKSFVYQTTDAARSVYLLAAGRVRVTDMNDAGKQSILAFFQPGRLFGELAICHARPREECCEAIEDSTVVVIPVSDFRQLIRANSELSFDIITLFGDRRRRIERRLKSMLFRSNRQRMVHVIRELAEEYGTPDGDGIRISIALSHQELGRLIGATRETVTIILGQLRNEGLVRIDRREIVITQPDRLQ